MRHALVVGLAWMTLALVGCSAPAVLPRTGAEAFSTPASEAPSEQDPTPQAAWDARDWLAAELGVPVDLVRIVDAQPARWRDACLELSYTGEACAQVTVPGWRVRLAAAGQTYEVRTDIDSEMIRAAQPLNRIGSGT